MIDQRFFDKKPFVTIKRICELLSINVLKGCPAAKRIIDVTTIDMATDSDITFFHNAKYASDLKKTKAFACIISNENKHLLPANTIAIVVDEPYLAYAILLKEFYSIKSSHDALFLSKKASIAKTAIIEKGCYISDFVTVSDGAIIKAGTYVGSNTTILHGVEIGENSYIESNVTIGFAVIGKSTYIKAGARIGQQGFGFFTGKTGITDILQVGKVIIGDDVQIGSNCTIDRGSSNDTKIGSHSRIDNSVHVAHNVEIGEYCVIAAQSGIAGSSKIGNQCFLGGQVGVVGHISIGDKVMVAAQSGVLRNTDSGSKIAGSPAQSASSWHRQTIVLKRLAEVKFKSDTKTFWSRLKLLIKRRS
ncbi:MAG: UDP-3-O-(3-hydroxymyristoyl)glucosamine N-acyltransferase [Holosporales bacterium]|jgi:UDP-3-O-[3-hydroxymyristoyl] glucosamine N-acyltransferase|nr:UDP-3-O-(3-hydroxymyristoyl)glucosamine N-acyltransferase [Holosporales bacterium]